MENNKPALILFADHVVVAYLDSLEFVEYRFILTCDFGKIPTSFGWFNRYPRNHPATRNEGVLLLLRITSQVQSRQILHEQLHFQEDWMSFTSSRSNGVKVTKLLTPICWQENYYRKMQSGNAHEKKSTYMLNACVAANIQNISKLYQRRRQYIEFKKRFWYLYTQLLSS